MNERINVANMYRNKRLTQNSAITLVALVITIIVLLILAGVTLNMVVGESGIFGKANQAKEKTQKSTAEEIIKLAALENEANKASGDNYLSKDELKKEITNRLMEQGYKVENNNIVTYYGEKTIKIDDFLMKEDSKETESITAENIQSEPSKYYGLKVTNYTSTNGQNDWRIFYSDGTHIFLITGDYINTAETNRIDKTATRMTTSGYCAYWDSTPSFQIVDDEVLTRFKAKEYILQSEINNSKCVSTLLNANNWKKYLDKEDGTGKAENAIGSPTVEMWMDSWNAKYPGDKVYRKASTSSSYPGYYVGTSENPTSDCIEASEMNQKEGYKDKLYYPHTSEYNLCNAYWLASPSVYNVRHCASCEFSAEV